MLIIQNQTKIEYRSFPYGFYQGCGVRLLCISEFLVPIWLVFIVVAFAESYSLAHK